MCYSKASMEPYKITISPDYGDRPETAEDNGAVEGKESIAVTQSSLQAGDKTNPEISIHVDDSHPNIFAGGNVLLECKVSQIDPPTEYIMSWYQEEKYGYKHRTESYCCVVSQ